MPFPRCLPLVCFALLLAAVPAHAESVTSIEADYSNLLAKHVDADGFVDYPAIAAKPQRLTRYVQWLSEPDAVPPADQRDERLARLINAYNAFTLQLILDHWGRFESGAVSSITQLHSGKPWDQQTWNLAGQKVSLNQIEHELIRRDLLGLAPGSDPGDDNAENKSSGGGGGISEPRIHWALVCAAYSCPPLRNEAYTAEQLAAQLADQEAYVLNFDHPRYLQKKAGELSVTKLFEWYGSDFSQAAGDWETYVLRRLDPEGLAPTVENEFGPFLDYDWSLNAKANRPAR